MKGDEKKKIALLRSFGRNFGKKIEYFKWLGTEIQYIKLPDKFFNEIKITLQQFVS